MRVDHSAIRIWLVGIVIFWFCLVPIRAVQVTPVLTEVYIPHGMPISIEIEPEQSPEMTKLTIKSIWGEEVTKVSIVQVIFSQQTHMNVRSHSSWKRGEPASIAWAPEAKVYRVVIIVGALETKNGKWEIDTPPHIGGDQTQERATLLATILETRKIPPA